MSTPSPPESSEAPAWLRPEEAGLTDQVGLPILKLPRAGAERSAALQKVRARAKSDGAAGVLLHIDGGAAQRVLALLTLPYRLGRLCRTIADDQVAVAGRYAVYPDAQSPLVVYPLGTAAAAYARAAILPAPAAGAGGLIKRLIGWLAGCHPSTGAILLVVHRRG